MNLKSINPKSCPRKHKRKADGKDKDNTGFENGVQQKDRLLKRIQAKIKMELKNRS